MQARDLLENNLESLPLEEVEKVHVEFMNNTKRKAPLDELSANADTMKNITVQKILVFLRDNRDHLNLNEDFKKTLAQYDGTPVDKKSELFYLAGRIFEATRAESNRDLDNLFRTSTPEGKKLKLQAIDIAEKQHLINVLYANTENSTAEIERLNKILNPYIQNVQNSIKKSLSSIIQHESFGNLNKYNQNEFIADFNSLKDPNVQNLLLKQMKKQDFNVFYDSAISKTNASSATIIESEKGRRENLEKTLQPLGTIPQTPLEIEPMRIASIMVKKLHELLPPENTREYFDEKSKKYSSPKYTAIRELSDQVQTIRNKLRNPDGGGALYVDEIKKLHESMEKVKTESEAKRDKKSIRLFGFDIRFKKESDIAKGISQILSEKDNVSLISMITPKKSYNSKS